MIRVNLLGVERQKVKKPLIAFDPTQSLTLICALILVATAAGIGWWFWSLRQESAQLDAEIVAAQQESARLQSLLVEVQQFEAQRDDAPAARRADRAAAARPEHPGAAARSRQQERARHAVADGDDAGPPSRSTIEGRSTTLIALSDFVGNLGSSDLLRKPIEIVESQVQPASSDARRSW